MLEQFRKKAVRCAAAGSAVLIIMGAVLMAFTAVPAYHGIFGYAESLEDKPLYHIFSFVIFFGGLALAVWGVVRIVRASGGATLKNLKETLAAEGCTEAAAEADYAAAVSFEKNDNIRIGKLFTYYTSGVSLCAIPNAKMMWVYQATTTHRTDGIKTGSTYSLRVYADGIKNCLTLPVSGETAAREILRKIDETMPWVVVGYTDEIKNLFNKNRPQFLELRYNKVAHTAIEPSAENANNG